MDVFVVVFVKYDMEEKINEGFGDGFKVFWILPFNKHIVEMKIGTHKGTCTRKNLFMKGDVTEVNRKKENLKGIKWKIILLKGQKMITLKFQKYSVLKEACIKFCKWCSNIASVTGIKDLEELGEERNCFLGGED